jgi:hypothetical protein
LNGTLPASWSALTNLDSLWAAPLAAGLDNTAAVGCIVALGISGAQSKQFAALSLSAGN